MTRPKKEGIIDVLLNSADRTGVEIIVGLKNGLKVVLVNYKIEKDKIYNSYWIHSAADQKKECILFKDIKELILAGCLNE